MANNITKLKLLDGTVYNMSAPILLDQVESNSTTSAPSSNYIKEILANLNQQLSQIYSRLDNIDEALPTFATKTSLESNISTINNNITSMQSSVNSKINSLTSELEELTSFVNDINSKFNKVTRLNDKYDLNALNIIGDYTVSQPLNSPGTGWHCIRVTRYDNNPAYPMQFALCDAGVFLRRCGDNVWKGWQKFTMSAA